MRLNLAGGIVAALVIVALIIAYGVDLHGLSDAPGDRRPARPAGRRHHAAGTALQDAADRQRDPHRQAHSRSRKSGAGSDRVRSEAARGRRLRALQDHRRAAVLSDGQLGRRRQFAALDLAQLGAAPRARREHADACRPRRACRADGEGARAARARGARTSASRSSTCGSAVPTCPSRTARRSTSACRRNGSVKPPSSAPRAASARRKSAPRPTAT